MVYRTLIDGASLLAESEQQQQDHPQQPHSEVLLHFGAIDWQADVYVNGLWVGSHEGGYDSFSVIIADSLQLDTDTGAGSFDEIMVVAYDPSNYGSQPFGKQRTSSMWRPAGDTYSPVSGIWQPVWLEVVPAARIDALKLAPNMTHLNLNVMVSAGGGAQTPVEVRVLQGTAVVANGTGAPNTPFSIAVPSPQLWSPEHPFLYNLSVRYKTDVVGSYFGMRTVSVCTDSNGTVRPGVNGQYRFLTGVLDQGFWSDGLYLAPGDAALAADLLAMKSLGQNYVRVHQKVQPDRWYYHADRLGVLVAQDMVQHYGDGVQGGGRVYQSNNGAAKARYYWRDLKAMIDGRSNHPSIFQWNIFNEQDMAHDFNATNVVRWVRRYDHTRLIDTDSGGPANDLHVGDADDLHVGAPSAANRHHPGRWQYMMDGEVTPLDAFWVKGHTWTDSANLSEVCRLYADPGRQVLLLQNQCCVVLHYLLSRN
jgi:beta-galactosidase/beta-glucuronidase